MLEAFAAYLGQELSPTALLIHREEVYAENAEGDVYKRQSIDIGNVLIMGKCALFFWIAGGN